MDKDRIQGKAEDIAGALKRKWVRLQATMRPRRKVLWSRPRARHEMLWAK